MKPEVFLLADEGYPGYAAMVLASDRLIAANPAAVRAFVEASAAGWRDLSARRSRRRPTR